MEETDSTIHYYHATDGRHCIVYGKGWWVSFSYWAFAFDEEGDS